MRFTSRFLQPSRLLALLPLSSLLVVVCLSMLGCDSALNTSQKPNYPEFQISELSGKVTTQADLAGKVVVINFWATSCTTCVKEMPHMIEVYKEFAPEGLDFLAIAMSYDPPMYVMNFAKTRSLPFRVAMDSEGKAAKAFGKIELTPTTIVMNHEGKVLKTYVGEPDWNEFRSVIKAALTAKSAAKSAA
jgi:peroxiredoxin